MARRNCWPASYIAEVSELAILDLVNNTISGYLRLFSGDGEAEGVVVSPDGQYSYATYMFAGHNWKLDWIYIINNADLTVVGQINLNTYGTGPLAITSDGCYLYVLSGCGTTPCYVSGSGPGTMEIIDTATQQIVKTLTMKLPFGEIVMGKYRASLTNPCGDEPCTESGSITIIDLQHQRVRETIPLPGVYGSGFITLKHAENPAYISDNCGTLPPPACFNQLGTVPVLDLSTDAVIATIPVGVYPE